MKPITENHFRHHGARINRVAGILKRKIDKLEKRIKSLKSRQDAAIMATHHISATIERFANVKLPLNEVGVMQWKIYLIREKELIRWAKNLRTK
jgi:hypothetical protein